MTSLFPYFGAKSKAASLVWEYLGDPECYVEPFAGSLAVLLARPTPARTEIAVDLDGLLVNFWRAVTANWPAVEAYLVGMVSETDIRAKHQALVDARPVLESKLQADVGYYDAQLAAWWWQGISSWLGSGFGHRVSKQRPHIDRSLKGAWATGMTDEKVRAVAARMANVILLAGDWQDPWKRSVTPAIMNRFDRSVGVFLDPPYSGDRQKGLYTHDAELNTEITEWCLAQPRHVKVVIAGYDHEYPWLVREGWLQVPWKASNGYAQASNRRRHQETLFVRRYRRKIRRSS